MEELLGAPLGREDRLFTIAALLQFVLLQGEDHRPLLAEFQALLSGEEDPNILTNDRGVRGFVALTEHRLTDAYELSLDAARLSPFNAPPAISVAAHAAAWARDADRLGRAVEAHVATSSHGGVIDHRRASMRAGLAGLEGRLDEAAEGYRTAIAGLRELGAVFEETLTGMDAVAVLGPSRVDPDVITAVRARLDELGAEGLRPVLDALVQPEPSTSRRDAAEARAGQTA